MKYRIVKDLYFIRGEKQSEKYHAEIQKTGFFGKLYWEPLSELKHYIMDECLETVSFETEREAEEYILKHVNGFLVSGWKEETVKEINFSQPQI